MKKSQLFRIIITTLTFACYATLVASTASPGTQPSNPVVTTNSRGSLNAAALARIVNGVWEPGSMSADTG